MKRRTFTTLCGASLAALAGLPLMAAAQPATTFPQKPVRIILPYSAGGATDAIMRLLAEQLSKEWGVAVTVDNRPGGNGAVGALALMQAPADGHTALFSLTGLLQNMSLMKKPPYDFFRDLAPVTMIGVSPIVFVTHPNGARNLQEYVAQAKKSGASFGSFGSGSSAHIFGAQLAQASGTDLTHVPYKGEQPMLIDLMPGRVDAGFVSPPTAIALTKAGKIRILAITGSKRSRMIPDAPTFRELGYAGMETLGWYGLFVKAGTAKSFTEKISSDLVRAARQPDIAQRLLEYGMEPVGNRPDEFGALLKDDFRTWDALIKKARIELE